MPTLLGYRAKPPAPKPSAELPAEKRQRQLEAWQTYDKTMRVMERAQEEREEKAKKAKEDRKVAREEAVETWKNECYLRKLRNDDRGRRRADSEHDPEEIISDDSGDDEMPTFEDSGAEEEDQDASAQKRRKLRFHNDAVFLAACAHGDLDEVTELLERGQDINTTNADGLTALHTAAIDGNYKVAEFLISNGININHKDNEGWTALHAAAGSPNLRLANMLLGKGAYAHALNAEGNMPSDVTEDKACKLLLQGALIRVRLRNEKDIQMHRRSEEILMMEEVVKLKEATKDETPPISDPNPNPRSKATLLHIAAAKGYTEILKILVQDIKMDTEAKDQEMWTALHAACHWERDAAVKILLDAGAKLTSKNRFGQTPVDVMSSGCSMYNNLSKLTVEAKKVEAEEDAARQKEENAQKQLEAHEAGLAARAAITADIKASTDAMSDSGSESDSGSSKAASPEPPKQRRPVPPNTPVTPTQKQQFEIPTPKPRSFSTGVPATKKDTSNSSDSEGGKGKRASWQEWQQKSKEKDKARDKKDKPCISFVFPVEPEVAPNKQDGTQNRKGLRLKIKDKGDNKENSGEMSFADRLNRFKNKQPNTPVTDKFFARLDARKDPGIRAKYGKKEEAPPSVKDLLAKFGGNTGGETIRLRKKAISQQLKPEAQAETNCRRMVRSRKERKERRSTQGVSLTDIEQAKQMYQEKNEQNDKPSESPSPPAAYIPPSERSYPTDSDSTTNQMTSSITSSITGSTPTPRVPSIPLSSDVPTTDTNAPSPATIKTTAEEEAAFQQRRNSRRSRAKTYTRERPAMTLDVSNSSATDSPGPKIPSVHVRNPADDSESTSNVSVPGVPLRQPTTPTNYKQLYEAEKNEREDLEEQMEHIQHMLSRTLSTISLSGDVGRITPPENRDELCENLAGAVETIETEAQLRITEVQRLREENAKLIRVVSKMTENHH